MLIHLFQQHLCVLTSGSPMLWSAAESGENDVLEFIFHIFTCVCLYFMFPTSGKSKCFLPHCHNEISV